MGQGVARSDGDRGRENFGTKMQVRIKGGGRGKGKVKRQKVIRRRRIKSKKVIRPAEGG